ncbi:unnamed protein product [Toxocara canis]|uniref:Transposase n=1 Tax=Toxocara canis TaxID=6265 RepID=A0A183V0Y6_TOXCA|nr:unnamed protein product [Toxocara canis]
MFIGMRVIKIDTKYAMLFAELVQTIKEMFYSCNPQRNHIAAVFAYS